MARTRAGRITAVLLVAVALLGGSSLLDHPPRLTTTVAEVVADGDLHAGDDAGGDVRDVRDARDLRDLRDLRGIRDLRDDAGGDAGDDVGGRPSAPGRALFGRHRTPAVPSARSRSGATARRAVPPAAPGGTLLSGIAAGRLRHRAGDRTPDRLQVFRC